MKQQTSSSTSRHMRWAVWFVLAVVGSLLLALWVARNLLPTAPIAVRWNDGWHRILEHIPAGGDTEGIPPTPSASTNAEHAQPGSVQQHVESHQLACRDLSAGDISRAPSEAVYRWVDAQGRVNLSDSPPNNTAVNDLEVLAVGGGQLEFFDLEIRAASGTVDRELGIELDIRARKAFEFLSGFLPVARRNKVSLNILVIDGQAAYLNYLQQTGRQTLAQSNGFYSMAENQAVIRWDGDRTRAIEVALHESVHVMNAGLFGVTPRWLNEGLAEYLESMQLYGQAMEVNFDSGWNNTLGTPMSVAQLVSASAQDWTGELRLPLYAHSRALVFFLMDDRHRKQVLEEYLQALAEDPCELLDASVYLIQRLGGVDEVNTRYQAWLSNPPQRGHLN